MSHRWRAVALLGWGALVVATLVWTTPVAASCQQTAREWYNPTGWEGCTRYGTGEATMWGGPGAARNDCTYPWRSCTPLRIQSLDTGISIVVQPTMFCDCWYNTPREALVDLSPELLRALGLTDLERGRWPVTVQPAGGLPDTAVAP